MIGTLPPNVGISDSCVEQLKHLSAQISVEFLDFSSLYPRWLHPGQVIEPGGMAEDLPDNVDVRRILSWKNPISWVWAGFTIKSKVVHVHWWTYFLAPTLLTITLISRLRRKKVIGQVHNVVGHESNVIDRLVCRLFYFCCDVIVVHSDANKKKMVDTFGLEKSRIETIPLGVPATLVSPVLKSSARKELGWPEDRRYILAFGNIRRYKGLDILLAAMSRVITSYPNICLVIAGKPWGSFDNYNRLINKFDLENKVLRILRFLESKEIPNIFSAVDLLVLPYKNFDAQSGPGRIALGYDLPMIVTKVGGLPDLVSDQPEFICEPSNVSQLSDRILQFLVKGNFPAQAEQRKSIDRETQFMWGDICNSWSGLYGRLQ
jgi:glycosyltransferase involved in cell wall biosynthesis